MGIASLGFAGGPSIKFRLDPVDINWNFKIQTNEIQTLGGRVVQVTGATLSDVMVTGQLGEQRGSQHFESWQLAESFFAKIVQIMDYQSIGSNGLGNMGEPAIFTYAPLKIRLAVYVKAIQDPDGGNGVTHRTGKFAYGYTLTLFVVQEGSGDLAVVGKDTGGYVNKQRLKAIEGFMSRIADGIGWKFSEAYNGLSQGSGIGGTAAPTGPPSASNIDLHRTSR
jgi:hypothetical protein